MENKPIRTDDLQGSIVVAFRNQNTKIYFHENVFLYLERKGDEIIDIEPILSAMEKIMKPGNKLPMINNVFNWHGFNKNTVLLDAFKDGDWLFLIGMDIIFADVWQSYLMDEGII